MLDAKKIRQFAIVLAIMDHKVRALAFFQRTYFIATTERVGRVNRGRRHCFSGSHFHLRTRQRKNHRHRGRRGRSRIEISGQHYGEPPVDHFTCRGILMRAECVDRARQKHGLNLRSFQGRDASGIGVFQMIRRGRIELSSERGAAGKRKLIGVYAQTQSLTVRR